MPLRALVRIAPLVALLAAAGRAWAADVSPADRTFFENRIRPVLVEHCYRCHSADAKEVGGNLLLDDPVAMRKGGQSGTAVQAGRPAESLLVKALRFDGTEMPPDAPLPESVIRDFEEWIRRGAPDPRVAAKAVAEDGIDPEASWSFLPRRDPEIPAVEQDDWPVDPIDRFVLVRLEGDGNRPARDADSRTLARRLFRDLVGLPPTYEELESFAVEHETEGAVAVGRLVDKLLSRPQFGERWGRHWLDVARYGESNGDDGLGRNASFPHAWRYRDYVIRAFNEDTPYDRFVVEQIAGDLLPAESAEQRNRQLIATGFLAIGSKPAKAMNQNFDMDVVDDQINVVASGILGLSVACARCHDHKHDPIPTRDYYALAGVFSSTETLYGKAANEKLTAPPTPLHTLISSWPVAGTTDAPLRFPESYRAAVDATNPVIHESLDAKPKSLEVHRGATFAPDTFATLKNSRITGRLAAGTAYSVAFWFRNTLKNDSRPITAYAFSRAADGDKGLPGDHLGIGGTHDASRTGKLFVFNGNGSKKSLAGATVLSPNVWHHVVLVRDGNRVRVHLNGADEPEIDGELAATFGETTDFRLGSRSDDFAPLEGNLSEFVTFDRAITDAEAGRLYEATGRPRPARTLGLAMGVRDKAKPADGKIHVNGGNKLGADVPRGVLTAYTELAKRTGAESIPTSLEIGPGESGRLQLARWLTRPDHPHTARVMVNRIWLHLFGEGIVATPDDFGVYGARPSHPELLDHLAERFVRDGWSTKRLIRAIVLSRTYQLASRDDSTAPVRSFGRHARRRLDAESLRDAMLQASGRLDPRPGRGSAVEKLDVLINWPPGKSANLHRPSNHRSIYLCMLRHAPPPELAAFDLPDGLEVVGRRSVSTLPTQSLYLLNGPFVVEQAKALADVVLAAPLDDDESRVRLLFRRTLQRDPSDERLATCVALVRSASDELRAEGRDAETVRTRAWAALVQAVFATNEFRYVD